MAPIPSPSAAQLTSWGLDPSWSRRVVIDGADRWPVDWHVLDTGGGTAGTIVCVHGNPSWGYIWRDLLTTLSPDWRVVAVDQTGMGWSERHRWVGGGPGRHQGSYQISSAAAQFSPEPMPMSRTRSPGAI